MHSKDKGFFKGFAAGILICVLVIAACALAGCFGGGSSSSAAAQTKQTSAETETGVSSSGADVDISGDYSKVESKLKKIQSVLDEYYIGNNETITADDMEEGIYKGYVNALDEPYTVYYTKDEYSSLMESTSGKYSGIGVVVTQNTTTGAVTVVRPFEGSPGAKAGLLKDDIIYKVGGKEATGVDLNEVVSWIKGKEGSSVKIEIYRPSESKYYTFKVERKEIEIPMVEHKMLSDKIGYVAIYEFESTTADQFDAAIDDLTAQGMKGLVIDLRDNPGGLLTSATAVLDRILPKDKLLVYTVDKKGKKEEAYSSDDDSVNVPMTVLINGNSASASEIVSGCLQDYGTAKLVGTTSFGKGIVQYVLPLDDGSAIKVTSAKYYTPKGRNIHGTGIDPDVKVELKTDSTSGSSSETGSTSETDSSSGSSQSDNQLDKAEQVIESEIAK